MLWSAVASRCVTARSSTPFESETKEATRRTRDGASFFDSRTSLNRCDTDCEKRPAKLGFRSNRFRIWAPGIRSITLSVTTVTVLRNASWLSSSRSPSTSLGPKISTPSSPSCDAQRDSQRPLTMR